jgi:hypothetical protein
MNSGERHAELESEALLDARSFKELIGHQRIVRMLVQAVYPHAGEDRRLCRDLIRARELLSLARIDGEFTVDTADALEDFAAVATSEAWTARRTRDDYPGSIAQLVYDSCRPERDETRGWDPLDFMSYRIMMRMDSGRSTRAENLLFQAMHTYRLFAEELRKAREADDVHDLDAEELQARSEPAF